MFSEIPFKSTFVLLGALFLFSGISLSNIGFSELKNLSNLRKTGIPTISTGIIWGRSSAKVYFLDNQGASRMFYANNTSSLDLAEWHNSNVPVLYSPTNPDQAVVANGFHYGAILDLIIGIFMGLCGLVSIFMIILSLFKKQKGDEKN